MGPAEYIIVMVGVVREDAMSVLPKQRIWQVVLMKVFVGRL